MIEEEPPDPLVQQGPVGGGNQNQENLNPLEAQQRIPDSLPDFEEHEPQATPDALGDLMDGVPPEEEEIPASPITPESQANAAEPAEQQSPPGLNAAGLNAADAPSPEEQIEQIEADSAFAVQIKLMNRL